MSKAILEITMKVTQVTGLRRGSFEVQAAVSRHRPRCRIQRPAAA
jgi:hypothetical protein